MSAPSPVRMTRNTSAFTIKHFEQPEFEYTKDFLIEEELERILNATVAPTMSTINESVPTSGALAPQSEKNELPAIVRTDSAISLASVDSSVSSSASVHSAQRFTSTAGTTPHRSRSSSKHDETKPTGLAVDHVSNALEQHLSITEPAIPRNAIPSQIPEAKANKQDPWCMSYPKPVEEVDVAACLHRKKLAGSPFERLQAARAAMSPAQRAEYDAQKAVDDAARWKQYEKERFEETIRNLTRPMGYAAAFNKAEAVKRPQTFMNGYGWYEEFDAKKGGFCVIEGQTQKYALSPPSSRQVPEVKTKQNTDVESMGFE